MATEIKLPDLGEGITSGTVAALIAQAGDEVGPEDAIIELETDKAVVPVPAGVAGVIASIAVNEGDEIKPGDLLATLATEGKSDASPAGKGTPTSKKAVPPTPVKEKSASPDPLANTPPTSSTPSSPQAVAKGPQNLVVSAAEIPAGPASRKLARELGVNLAEIPGSARGGRVTLDDVKAFVKTRMSGGGGPTVTGSTSLGLTALPDFSSFGETQREKITKLRGVICERMASNWANIPHVHQFGEVDITDIIALQKKYGPQFKEKGSALSVTQFLLKGLAGALKEFPQFNASFDHLANEVVYKKYFHIGVAVDTPSGLIVPVLRNVDAMSIFAIGRELKNLAQKTRERKVSTEELRGGCITLSNLGGIGGTHFTPIINHPEVAILGVGRSAVKPLYIGGEFVPRTILPLCLAYDHRVIDGADGARFMVFLNDYLENIEYHMMV